MNQQIRALILVVLWGFITTGLGSCERAPRSSVSDLSSLAPGHPARGSIAGDARASYAFPMEAGEFVLIRVLQLSVDVVVTAYHPDGHVLREVDALTDGPEFIALTSETAGTYRIDIRPFDPGSPPGEYLAEILKKRKAAENLSGRIDEVFAEFDEVSMPGAIVAVVQDGKILHTAAYGMADLEQGKALTPSTPVNICSIGKQLTAYAIAFLADRGQLGLDDDVRSHLPWVPDFDHRITIGDLIHHTSGLRELDDLVHVADEWNEPLRHEDVLSYVRRQRELNFPPGTDYLYSNTGYVLLAEVVESVTGQSFPEWAQTNIFEPLGMHDTFFWHDPAAVERSIAWSYELGPGGGYRRVDMLPIWYVGAGNMYASAADLGRWLQHLDNPRICPPRVVAAMSRGAELENGETTRYAFAQDRQTYRGLSILEHGGGGWGYQSHVLRFPEQRFSVIVASNFIYGRAYSRAREVADLLLADHVLAEKPGDEYVNRRRAVAVAPGRLARMVGKYRPEGGAPASITMEANGLFIQFAGHDRVRLHPSSSATFFFKEADVQIEFTPERGAAASFRVITPADTVTYVRMDSAAARETMGVRVDLAGSYLCPELGVRYRVSPGCEGVRLGLPHGDTIDCPLVGVDRFHHVRGSTELFSIAFDRDEDSRVTGFRLTSQRSRNIQFLKEDLGPSSGG